ncbi:glucoamylase family protein [Carboxylicivirga linearis]|uniref:Glycoamylase-like domain-containing protein n=1 Tax=Carboxylicivirga linearis TaxID=1628157 RepID=A0ABS5JRT9_9BACT|nr:glucoamylase family protein [Carboxylicivirga linearis]MBS2097562.1 hypothetical protein [Carboxylicivirga linearis]
MKYLFVFIFSLISVCILKSQNSEREFDCVFFDNSPLIGEYFFSEVQYSQNSYVKNRRGKLLTSEDHFFTPPNSLELAYYNGSGVWKAGILFENIRGNDFFKSSRYVSFWMKMGETRKDILPKIALCIQQTVKKTKNSIPDEYSDALQIATYITNKEKNGWQFVKIPLEDFGFKGKIPNKIVFSNSNENGEGKVFIDQLELLPDVAERMLGLPSDIHVKGYEQHVDVIWDWIDDPAVKYVKIYRSEDNENFEPVGTQRTFYKRYSDFTNDPGKSFYYKISLVDYQYNESELSKSIKADTRMLSDEELLDMVQEASFRYYWEAAEPNSGLALENIPGRKNMIATGASGFGIMALIVGAERGFITRTEAVDRMLTITRFLSECDKFHGAVSHFIDGPTGKVEPFFGERDNGGDLVETSFLFQGLLAARQYFTKDTNDETEIRSNITSLWEDVEWDWYDREKENKYLTWHWSPDKGWVINHKLIGWNETMITYLLAIASPTHSVPADMYYNGWASQEELAVTYRKAWGNTDDGSFYTNGNYYHGVKLPVGVGNGGPLFFIHYSFMGFNPHLFTDKYTNYFDNNQRIALINWRYCSVNPKNYRGMNDSFWGLTASDGPWGYNAIEPKIEKDNGTLAPTGALASFPYTPEQSMEALKNMYRNHGKYLWGEYGFKDAVNLEENWCAGIYMGLNQAPVTVMIENYRTGLIWNLFMKNKEIQEAISKIHKL